jgi:hypothetical protein
MRKNTDGFTAFAHFKISEIQHEHIDGGLYKTVSVANHTKFIVGNNSA